MPVLLSLWMLFSGLVLGACFTVLFFMRITGRGWKINFTPHYMKFSKAESPTETN